MAVNFVEYRLDHGFINNWLVAGPQVISLKDFNETERSGGNLRRKAGQLYHLASSPVSAMPVDRDTITVGEDTLDWTYIRCYEDHFVDVSRAYPGPVFLRTWAYAQIKTKDTSPMTVNLALTTAGLADIYLNGNLVHRKEDWSDDLETIQFQVELQTDNELLIQFEAATSQECFNGIAVQVQGFPTDEKSESISVVIPSHVRFPNRQQQLERILENAYLEEVVNSRGAKFNLRWAEDLNEQFRYAYQVQDVKGSIYVEGTWDTEDHNPLDIGHGYRLYERPFRIVLKATPREYFEHDLRYQRSLPLHVLDTAYAHTAYGSYADRRMEALKDAVKHETSLFGLIARLELEKWNELNTGLIINVIERIKGVDNDSPSLLLGLLIVVDRYLSHASFPESLKQPIIDCILAYPYEAGFPGKTETDAILISTCEVIAGQLYPDETFLDAHTGEWHRLQGEGKALSWLKYRGQYGFMEWNSNQGFESNLLALSQLASQAKSSEVAELAAILLDKMLFTLAVNSYKGVFGVSHGRTQSSMIKSAQLEATSGVSRLLWGMGVFNHHILGTVGLACSDYEFPTFLTDIAVNYPDEMLSREHHTPGPESNDEGVNLVNYKTPDYMLSSAQDYHKGQRGASEHILQATFGPDAVVFINHPTSMSEYDGNLPGFWLGNRSLPRVAQWKDVLVAIYNLPEDDWMGFTHAYFPIYQFDEYSFKNNWAFARKGDGYLAITAAEHIEHIWRGPDGYRELRSYGKRNIWLIQMGRRSQDGGFGDFRLKVLRIIRPNWEDTRVNFQSLRGEKLAFGWEGAFSVNDLAQPLTGFKHIENPFCSVELPAKQMDISYGENAMRLTFE